MPSSSRGLAIFAWSLVLAALLAFAIVAQGLASIVLGLTAIVLVFLATVSLLWPRSRTRFALAGDNGGKSERKQLTVHAQTSFRGKSAAQSTGSAPVAAEGGLDSPGSSAEHASVSANSASQVPLLQEQQSGDSAEETTSGAATAEAATVHMVSGDKAAVIQPGQLPGKRAHQRLYFLDNVKSFLTVLVVVHHVTCAFVGDNWYYAVGNYHQSFQAFGQAFKFVNQSYFMCLFFFISGYFTPSSYARKGPQEFLKDKFKRLGLPFLVCALFIYPMLTYMALSIACGDRRCQIYFPDAGVAWFLLWLLIFNVVYTTLGEREAPATPIPLPGPIALFLVATIVTAAQVGIIVTALTRFIFMPFTVGSLLFDIVFFFAGSVAKQGGWLDTGLDQMSSVTRIGALLISFVYIVAVFLISLLQYLGGGGGLMPSKNGPDDQAHGRSFNLPVQLQCIFSGFFTVSFSLVTLLFFRRFFNYENRFTKFFANASYTLYIIHPVVVVLFTWSYIALLTNQGNEHIAFPSANTTTGTTDLAASTSSSSIFSNAGLIWGGWLFTSVMSLCVGFPVASVLRSLPVLRDIL
jgi:glucan biosynthesis protein C